MTEASTAQKPRGLFKRDTKGISTEPVKVTVERGRIQFLAQVLGETDPLFTDIDAARSMGHPDIAAPPSFFMVVEALAADVAKKTGQQSGPELVGCDVRYLLHGDEHYTYHGLIYAGDEVELSTTVVDFYDKKGGAMEFVVFKSVITHRERGLLVQAKRTLLHRLG